MLHQRKNKKRTGGFTMVELMVVLAIMGILAALVGGGLIAYTRLARFEKNEANARTLFQAAQISLTRMDTAGELDAFCADVEDQGKAGTHFTDDVVITDAAGNEVRRRTASELNNGIYALYYDKTDGMGQNELVQRLLDDYIYDDSMFNAAICVEIDRASGQVYSVFYDTNSDKLRFAADGVADATDITDRSYDHRRNDSLVGYYSAEDRVNVVELQQTKLKVKNPRLSNGETLTLNWGGNSNLADMDTVYTAVAYRAEKNGLTGYKIADESKPLFSIEIKRPNTEQQVLAELETTVYTCNADGTRTETKRTLRYPLSYNKGNFVLTLDAMADASLLRACEKDTSTADNDLYSITRLLAEPENIIIRLQAAPRDEYADSYTASKSEDSNAENTLFAIDGTKTDAELKYFRHLYNVRWAKNWGDAKATYTLKAQGMGANGLNWTGGGVTVYTAAGVGKNPEAKVPSQTDPVAWPTIPALGENITLQSETTVAGTARVPILNLQLRGNSVAAVDKTNENPLDRYVGLVGENNGTISHITLRDADVQVNTEIKALTTGQSVPEGGIRLTNTTYLAELPEGDTARRDGVRAVGALCGVNTGTLQDCTLLHGTNNAYKAQVLATLHFDDDTTEKTRIPDAANKYYEHEPQGIGGLVGVAIPKNDAGTKLENLTVGENVTVAGLLVDDDTTDTTDEPGEAGEKARYTAVAADAGDTKTATRWRSVGVGGVFGTLDAANLKTDDKTVIANAANVTGSGFVGGIAGNLYSTDTAADGTIKTIVNRLASTGTVSAGVNYQGDNTKTEHSLVLGQFFGGIAGYTQDVVLANCTSTARGTMTETDLRSQVDAGYASDGTLNDNSPLKGDFVGGLVGFGKNILLQNSRTEKGYVLGSRFVGGLAGGFTGSTLHADSAANTSDVFGNRYVGGIVSVNGSGSIIQTSTNSGLVAGLGKNAAYVGGIVGVNDATWGADGAAQAEKAQLINCTNSMSGDNATDSRRIRLLQALSTHAGITEYANYVGGLVGYNGTKGSVTWDQYGTPTLGAILYGDTFVGGLAGYNDVNAAIINTSGKTLIIRGQIVADGDAVGGLIGLNTAPILPTATVAATRVEGVHFVGGVIGANMPVGSFTVQDTLGKAGALTTTVTAGRVRADGVAGGIIGYNRLLATLPQDVTHAAMLPTFSDDNVLIDSTAVTSSEAAVCLENFTNTFNLEANAYVGGILGYNDAATNLTIRNAVNGSSSNALAVGGLSMGTDDTAHRLYQGVKLLSLNQNYEFGETRGYLAGGIIGFAAQNTTLENCTSYGNIAHACAAGGLTGWNDGTISGGMTCASLGSQQAGYLYLGGIAGVNTRSIANAAPDQGVVLRGNQVIGGIAGINMSGAAVTYDQTATPAASVVATYCAGGVAGVNCGTITLGSTTQLNFTVTATTYAGGIAGSNNARGSTRGLITGGVPMAQVTATTYAGGAAGINYADIRNVNNQAPVRANDTLAGGIAGQNAAGGVIDGCRDTNREVYATNGVAGGIAGTNAAGAAIRNAEITAGATVTAANGAAGGFVSENSGLIENGTVRGGTINFTGGTIGAVVTYNRKGGTIRGTAVAQDAKVHLNGPATIVGGIAGRNEPGEGTTDAAWIENASVNAGALDLNGLTVNANLVTLGGAVGSNAGKVKGTNVTLSVTEGDKLERYQNLGGVAGQNDGTLDTCTYQGTLGLASAKADGDFAWGAASRDGNTIGGIAGVNNGTVQSCAVPAIVLQARGSNNVSSLQTDAQKLDNATHVGGIAGRNNGTISASYVATDANGKSIIAARYGFVGGVAGSNSGSITNSGSQQAQALVSKVNNEWLPLNTDDANTGINAMVAELTKTNGTYTGFKGVDTVGADDYGYGSVYLTENKTTTSGGRWGTTTTTKAGLAANDLTVVLRGNNNVDNNDSQRGSGYLGGITGYNSVTGAITDSATGRWFVYGDNISKTSTIGGIVGTNISSKDLTTLVNCAAVRRYTRLSSKKNDDNTTNEYTSAKATRIEVHVGGIIGHQGNDRDDLWALSKCVNYGTVYNSRSNNIGGIVSYWTDYGGTIEYSFNFGDLLTNMNDNWDSCGTMGGIAGYFDAPVKNTSANILHCQNHGSMKGTNNKSANDIGGIFGKVQMADKTDPMTINVYDCVNGSTVEIKAQSMAVGIFGYLGPWDTRGSTIDNVIVNIDRCRNYCTNMSASYKVGIVGSRGGGGRSTQPTTLNNCFSLVGGDNWHPLAYDNPGVGAVENIKGSNNYYIDAYSKDGKSAWNAQAWNERWLGHTSTNLTNFIWSGADSRFTESAETKNCGGRRLNLGKDTTDNSYFAMLAVPNNTNDNTTYDLSRVVYNTAYIHVDATDTWKRTVETKDSDVLGNILLRFTETNDSIKGSSGQNIPSNGDITDEVIQNYYKYVLEANEPNQIPESITIQRSEETKDGTGAVYGRYLVSWTAPKQDAAHGPAMYYKLEVYKTDASGIVTDATPIHTAMVYETKYTFDNDPDRDGWTGNFVVRITPMNSKGGGTSRDSAVQTFAQTLPKPEMEVRLKRTGTGNIYYQTVVLTNYDEYVRIANDQWKVDFNYVDGSSGSFSKGKSEQTITDGLDNIRTLTAIANPSTSTAPFMRSEQFSERTAIAGPFTNPDKNNEWNTGLAAKGNVTVTNPTVTGTTVNDLTISLNLSYAPFVRDDNKMQEAQPIYRVMLVGKYVGDSETTASGTSLTGQYITLAAQQTRVGAAATTVTFRNLPKEAFTSDYKDLKIVAAPVESGIGPSYSRWAATEEEVTEAIDQRGTDNPVAYYDGLEIVRKAGGDGYEYAHMTALYFVGKAYNTNDKDKSYNNVLAPAQVKTLQTGVTTLQAPTLDRQLTKEEVRTAANKLYYTFSWTQTTDGTTLDTTVQKYTIELYGVQADGKQETIRLASNVDLADRVKFDNAGRYTLELCVDADLAEGSKSWKYNNVILHVARVSGTNAQIGLADEQNYDVMTRLDAPDAPGGFTRLYDENSADALTYSINWPAVVGADHYTLYAKRQNADTTWKTVETWENITGTQTEIDMEQYQGQELRFYVIANRAAGDTTGFDSPDGALCDPQAVKSRVAAPTVSSAAFAPAAPSQAQFLNGETLQMTVSGNKASSYFFTGYLFKEKANYQTIAALANAWQTTAALGKEKADKLAALQIALDAMLKNGDAICIIPESDRQSGGGTPAGGSGDSAAYNLSNGFTMKPEYSRYYLLPALRAMAETSSGMESSNWYYYVGDYTNNPAAMQLPAIKLDAPNAGLTAVGVDYTVDLYDSDAYTSTTGKTDEITLNRFAVQWQAANRYPSTGTPDDGRASNLTDYYKFTVTSANGTAYTIEMWTYDADTETKDADGNTTLHSRGEIRQVKKTVTINNTAYTTELTPQNVTDADGNVTRTWYDLSVMPVFQKDTTDVDHWESKPEWLRGCVTQDDNAKPYYQVSVVAELEVVENDNGEPAYRVLLPDMANVLTSGDALQKFTTSIQVETMAHSKADGKTVGTPDAEAVKIGNETQTVDLIAEEPTPDENTETTQPTETPAEPQNAPQPVELTDKAG